jgi:hypothetical protein
LFTRRERGVRIEKDLPRLQRKLEAEVGLELRSPYLQSSAFPYMWNGLFLWNFINLSIHKSMGSLCGKLIKQLPW